ncbi:MAG: AAA family ATPase [Acidimicrobiales bacterium]
MANGSQGPRKRPRGDKKRSWLGIWTAVIVLVLVGSYFGLIEVNRPKVAGDRLRLDSFVDLAERGRLRSARVLNFDSYAVGRYERDDGSVHRYNAVFLKESQSQILLVNVLLENRVPTTVDQQTKKRLISLVTLAMPGFILIVLFVYLILSSRRGTGLFKVKSGARRIEPEPGGTTFADVAGQDAAVAELREIKDFLADPGRYAEVGAQIPKGVLLYGPPGCGKTLLAKAVAGEAGASFYSISGSDFVELYVGVGAARVRDLFKVARENAPSVIFIDELDSIGRSRGGSNTFVGDSGEREQALNQVLAEMDGFSPSDGIIVLAATNRPDILDPALLRPGRLDRSIGLERPDESARLAILAIHSRGKQLDADVDLADVARRGVGFTGADLASVLNEAALLAARADKAKISQAELDKAVQRILSAPERQRRLSMRDKSIGRRFSEEDKVTFDDVAGQEEAVKELREIKEYLAEPERYQAVGATVPKGVLLFGPPGCGKTLMARALAGEANAAFISVSASEVVGAFVGEGAARIRDLFAEARQMAPAILFIDELDSLGYTRAGTTGDRRSSGGQEEQALNQILTELDGFTASAGVIVLGATNRPDVLDPALLRPGRFDRTIGLDWPNETARLAILALHAKGRPLAADVDLAVIAGRANGLNGADLANIINEAALLAARRDKPAVGRQELDDALQRVLQAPDRQRRLSMRSKSIGRRFAADERVTFADVAGVDDAVEELHDVRDYLAAPDRFAALGALPPRGILLTGPPGCGKTLLARAVAGEANAAFISASGSEFVEVFVGEGAARVRDLFAEARSMAPAILFIDEIDAVGGSRSPTASRSGGGREFDTTLNQLLVELDGFEPRTAVIVIAATNRPEILDDALRRPGRFDRTVEITHPDREGRRAILDIHAKDKPLAADVDLDKLAGLTRQFSGADLANVLNEAALLATRKGVDEITMEIIDEAIDRAYLGITSRRHVMSEEERRVTAYHEAGHALVALSLDRAATPHRVTILPRGGTAGHCILLDDHDVVLPSRSQMLARMAVSMGGWAAEMLVFDEPAAGSSADLKRVRQMAEQMVCELGMSEELGPMTASDERGYDGRRPPLSDEATAAIRRLVDQATVQARTTLTAQRKVLDRIAEALLERETLTRAELEALADTGRRPKA